MTNPTDALAANASLDRPTAAQMETLAKAEDLQRQINRLLGLLEWVSRKAKDRTMPAAHRIDDIIDTVDNSLEPRP